MRTFTVFSIWTLKIHVIDKALAKKFALFEILDKKISIPVLVC